MPEILSIVFFGIKIVFYFCAFWCGIFLGIIIVVLIADFLFKIFYSFK